MHGRAVASAIDFIRVEEPFMGANTSRTPLAAAAGTALLLASALGHLAAQTPAPQGAAAGGRGGGRGGATATAIFTAAATDNDRSLTRHALKATLDKRYSESATTETRSITP